jgi:7-cyano-7-deazaguanine synthase
MTTRKASKRAAAGGSKPLARCGPPPGAPPRKAVVLLSGGLDSKTTLAIARAEGFEAYALSFDYGQRHRHELEAARRVAARLGAAAHHVVRFDLRPFGGSALTGDIPVPKDRAAIGDAPDRRGGGAERAERREGLTACDAPDDIPVTYVPARNTIFLSFALAWAETLGAEDVFIGVNALDYSGYPDCRPEYIEAFERMAHLATRAGVTGRSRLRIRAPLIAMTKAQIVRRGLELGVDYAITHSCYDPASDGAPCGRCDSCRLRRKGFREAGAADPLVYPEGKA